MYEPQKRYDKKNTTSFSLKLNYNTDADLIAFLESHSNVQGFIKQVLKFNMYYDSNLRRHMSASMTYIDTDSIKEETNENQNK